MAVITESNTSNGNYFLANSFLFKKKKNGKSKNFTTQGNQNDSVLMNSSKHGISIFPNSNMFKNSQNNTMNFALKKKRDSSVFTKSHLVKELIKNQKTDSYKSGIVIPKMRRRKSRNKITFKKRDHSSTQKKEQKKFFKKNLEIHRPRKRAPQRMYTPSLANNVFAEVEAKKLVQTSGKFYTNDDDGSNRNVTPKSRASKNFSKVAENILNKDPSNPTLENVSRNSQNYGKMSSVDRSSHQNGHQNQVYLDLKRQEENNRDEVIKTVDLSKRTQRPDLRERAANEKRRQKEVSDKMRKSYFEQFKVAQDKNEEARKESKKEAQRRRDELQSKVEKLRAFRKAQAEEEKKKKMALKIKDIHRGKREEEPQEHKKLKEETTKPEVSSATPSTMIKWTSDSWPSLEEELFFGKCIGEGSFAKVYEGFDKLLKRWVAIKIIKKKHFIRKNKQYLIQNEVDIIAALAHKNIIKFERLVEDHKRVRPMILTSTIGVYSNGAGRAGNLKPVFKERVQRQIRRGGGKSDLLSDNQRSETYARQGLLP